MKDLLEKLEAVARKVADYKPSSHPAREQIEDELLGQYLKTCNPQTILQLTSALRTAIEALESLSFWQCTACHTNMETRNKALASISAAVGGRGGK